MTKSTKILDVKSPAKQAPAKQPSDLLTVAEVSHILRVDDATVRRWIKEGALEAVVLPHRNERQAYRIKREALEQLLGKPTHAR